MMVWTLGGVIGWLGGWWFTGRLFAVYRKAVYLEDCEHRHRHAGQGPDEHHHGILLFALLDLGLLLVGIRGLDAIFRAETAGGDAPLLESTAAWSFLVGLWILRQGTGLHHLYHDRWRALTGEPAAEPGTAGTLRGLWRDTGPILRIPLLLGPLLGLVPLAAEAVGLSPAVPGPGPDPRVTWLLVPQGLLLLALAQPLFRLRRLVRGDGA